MVMLSGSDLVKVSQIWLVMTDDFRVLHPWQVMLRHLPGVLGPTLFRDGESPNRVIPICASIQI